MAILFTLGIFAKNLRGGNRRRNSFRILFWRLAWDSNPGFSSNKPTHYLLDHGDFIRIHTDFNIIEPPLLKYHQSLKLLIILIILSKMYDVVDWFWIFITQHIDTYIIGHCKPSARIIDLVSHTAYIMCVNSIHKWRDLQFKVDSKRQTFWETFHLLVGNRRRNSFCILFWGLSWSFEPWLLRLIRQSTTY